MNRLNISKTGNVVGILSVAFFVLCMLWGITITTPELKDFHKNILEIAYPGFGFGLGGLIIGLIEAYIYGWVFGALFAWLCKKICIVNK
ncbi:MAG: hypothetical protein Q8P83_03375 [bacterium]|nr:hypothetical protein [bacterium]